MPVEITVIANGEAHKCQASLSLKAFLESKGLKPNLVVVELNQEALTPSEAATKTLNDGDRLEIVKIVAGG